MTANYYKGAKGVLIVYDVTKEDTFDNLTTWLDRVESSANDSKIVKMLIGNKIDLENIRNISSKDGEEFA